MKTILYLFGNVLMMLIMGTVYAWSVFRVEVETVFDASTLESGLPYMTSLFFYALSMMVSGRFLNERTMRRLALLGGALISAGWMIAAFSSGLFLLTLGYGVIIGTGVGMVYGVPVYHINRLYEGKSGLYTGIVLGGFGASPLVTAPVVSLVIRTQGLMAAFLVMGLASLVVLLPLAWMFKRSGLKSEAAVVETKPYDKQLFWMVYALFLSATAIGLMMIGLTYRIGVTDYAFNANHVALTVSLFAVLNGSARPFFGHLMDTRGFVKSAFLSVGLIVLAALIAFINRGQSLTLYIISFGLFWFNLGAWLAMVPAAIKEYFGKVGYAKRYGVAFTAYGLGAIGGTLLSGFLLDVLDDTRYVYGMILLITAVMAAILFKVMKKENLNNA